MMLENEQQNSGLQRQLSDRYVTDTDLHTHTSSLWGARVYAKLW